VSEQLRIVAVVGSLRRESFTRRVVLALKQLVPKECLS
jgi:NAD(P)H-dependent FMN reductase